jgi:hypothetical protein
MRHNARNFRTVHSDVALARRFNPQVTATVEGYSDDEVWSQVAVMRRSDDQQDQPENPRLAEFATLAGGTAVIGTPTPDALLHAKTLPKSTWTPAARHLIFGCSSPVARSGVFVWLYPIRAGAGRYRRVRRRRARGSRRAACPQPYMVASCRTVWRGTIPDF